ncbi:DedA family protein [Nocardioides gansuensis]|uniref:DedA family protein n=1 Tax=Nocardioides gansuensis TaxID=2138300 RepID=A0A2T8FB10_9ACTN|nr:DedA family protein [Nocardioides gansuensis]
MVESLLHFGPLWVYAAIMLLVLAESALFVGFVLPGEASVLLGGMLASLGRLDLAVLVPLVIAAAVTGDAIGFWVGRRCGPWLLERPLMRRHADRVERLRDFIRRRGGWAILTGRFTALIRAMTPLVAGMSGLGWRTFLVYDVVGGVAWAGGVALLGYAAGQSYTQVADRIGQAGAAVVALLVAGGGIMWWRSRGRAAGIGG